MGAGGRVDYSFKKILQLHSQSSVILANRKYNCYVLLLGWGLKSGADFLFFYRITEICNWLFLILKKHVQSLHAKIIQVLRNQCFWAYALESNQNPKLIPAQNWFTWWIYCVEHLRIDSLRYSFKFLNPIRYINEEHHKVNNLY